MIARTLAMAILGRISVGQLTVIEDDRETVFGSGAPQATVHVHDPRVWSQILRGGRGMGETYMDGLWDTPDLTAKHGLAKVAIHHRVGRVEIGEPSVVIAVSAAHRAAGCGHR